MTDLAPFDPSSKPVIRRLRGPWDWLRIQMKELARSLIYGHLIRRIETTMSLLNLKELLDLNDRIVLKPIRPYLIRGLGPSQRAEAVIQHYTAMHARMLRDVVLRAHTSRQPLWGMPTEIGLVSISLAEQSGFYREAELRLVLELDGVIQLEMGISIVSEKTLSLPGNNLCLWIGIIKSSTIGEQGLENSRQLTKTLEGMRPKSLLLLAGQVLSLELGLTALYAVSNEGRIFSGYNSLKKRVKADYDQFWEESDGQLRTPYVFQIPQGKPVRDISTYKPNKRAQARRRQALEAEITAALLASISKLLIECTSV